MSSKRPETSAPTPSVSHVPAPAGVRPVVVDAATRRGHIREKTVQGLESLFPLISRDGELHVENVRVKPAVYSSNDQKTAILHGRTLTEPVVGDLILKDKDGKVVDRKKNHILAHLPYFTERHSMIVGGNEYEVPSQLRLKPGVYTRERGNGEFEAAFNLSKGDNFRISMEPETGKLRAEIGTTTIPLRPVLKALGVTDATMKQYWGDELFHANTSARGTSDESAVNKLVERLKRPKDVVANIPEAKKRFLETYFDSTRMDPEVNARTLGKAYDRVTPMAMLDASKKLLKVHRGEDVGDDRDSLEFKTVHTVDDFFKERLEKDARRTIAPKLVWKLNQGKDKPLKEVVPNSTFTKSLTSFLTSSAIAAIPTQYSPVELIDHASKITSLGEGGISSDRAIPFEARKTHATHLGILDPVRTPECHSQDTEVFTSEGWVPWPAVTPETLFACQIGGQMVFRRAEALFRAPYEGPMYQVRTAFLNLCVTPNHRMYLRTRRSGSPWQFRDAETAFGRACVMSSRHAPAPGAELQGTHTVPALTVMRGARVWKQFPEQVIDIDVWAEFLGWYLSEGFYTWEESPARFRVSIGQSLRANPHKYAKIAALLSLLPWNWHSHATGFVIASKQLAQHLRVFGRSEEKHLPPYAFTMPASARLRLLNALFDGDGHTRPGACAGTYNTRRYATCSPQLAQDVVRLAAGLGMPVRLSTRAGAKAHYKRMYHIAFLQHAEFYVHPHHWEEIPYRGEVFCATVPGGLLYTRRGDGVPVWSGNSGHAGIDVRAAIGAHRDPQGNLYGVFKDARTGKVAPVSVMALARATVAFSGQEKEKGNVDALRGGDVVSVPRSDVDYYLSDPQHMFSPATALVPFINGAQGNRNMMSAKFQTQALPLLERDVPYVQAAAPRSNESMTKEIARLVVPTAPVSGTVAKVDKDYIYIRPDASKKASEFDDLEAKLADYLGDDLEELALQVPESLIEAAKLAAATAPDSITVDPAHVFWRTRTHNHDYDVIHSPFPGTYSAVMGGFFDNPGRRGEPARHDKGVFTFPDGTTRLGVETSFADPLRNDSAHREIRHTMVWFPPEGQIEHVPSDWGEQLWAHYQKTWDPVAWEQAGKARTWTPPGPVPLNMAAGSVNLPPTRQFSADPMPEQVLRGGQRAADAVSPSFFRRAAPYAAGAAALAALGYGAYRHLTDEPKTAAAKKLDPDADLIKLPYDTNFPLAAKTYLHNTVKVKEGDKVHAGQLLADSNFTKDDHIALGKNLSVGYLAYYGKNSNDAVVISEGAAKKLTSEHMYKETLRKGPDTVQSKPKYLAYYGLRFTKAQLDKLDENGIAKPGQHFEPGDPLILALEKAAPSPDAIMLGHLHKSLVKPYRDATVVWEHHTPGEAVEAVNAARQAVVTIRTHESMKIGDKLANRFGGKGVVSEIIPDHKMVQDEKGKPIDVLFTSAGIVSRINPAQVVEGALGKVVEKTGKPYVLPQFMDGNNVEFAKKELAKHGVKDKETVYDPVSGRKIPEVFVGRSYIHKLFKSTESNYAARGVSTYDVNLQPTKGGEEGAKGLGKMEINTLLAHNARNVLKDAMTVKSEKSDDYWRALEFGLPPPPPKSPFVVEKLTAMMQGAGVNVDKRGTNVALGALTDKHVEKMSSGALTLPELEKSKSFMVTAKDLKPEKGGLFDPVLTGGLSGTRWSHIELPEPTLNPVFEDPARRLLGMTKAQLRAELTERGGTALRKRLNDLDIDDLEKKLTKKTETARGADLDNLVKQIKYIRALREQGHRAGDAYTISKIPVIPPVMRPILPSQKGGELQIADPNYLYRDLALAASGLHAAKETGLSDLTAEARAHMYDAQAALAGVGDPVSPQLQGRGVKGFISQIGGQGSPKQGFLFKKVLKRQQDLSMRATATPDNTLDMDQIGVPEDMLWTTYEKFIMRTLIGQGYPATRAKEMIEERHPAAKQALEQELRVRPVFVNRAPSLHKHNMVAAFPVPVQGKSLRINPFMEKGQNLDYDGDTMQLHVPVSPKAVAEARDLTLSKLLFSDKSRDDLMIFPQHEAIIGTYLATAKGPKGPKRKFKTKADALAAYKRGEITLETPVEIG